MAGNSSVASPPRVKPADKDKKWFFAIRSLAFTPMRPECTFYLMKVHGIPAGPVEIITLATPSEDRIVHTPPVLAWHKVDNTVSDDYFTGWSQTSGAHYFQIFGDLGHTRPVPVDPEQGIQLEVVYKREDMMS